MIFEALMNEKPLRALENEIVPFLKNNGTNVRTHVSRIVCKIDYFKMISGIKTLNTQVYFNSFLRILKSYFKPVMFLLVSKLNKLILII